MDEYNLPLIEFIETRDWTPIGVQASVKRACRHLRTRRGYAASRFYRKYMKNLGNRRVRRYFKQLARGSRPPRFHPVTGWDII
jgi:hypothetical protein